MRYPTFTGPSLPHTRRSVFFEIDPLMRHAVSSQELTEPTRVGREARADQLDSRSGVDQDRSPGDEGAKDQVAQRLVLGDDLAEGKPTLPLIHALKNGTESQRAEIRLAIEQGGLAQLEPVIAAIESTGGLEYAARFAGNESELALMSLDALPDSPFKEGLAALARFAVERTT